MTEARYCSSSPYFSSLGHFTVNEKIDICRGLFAFLVVAAHAVDISWSIHPEVPGQLSGWLHDLLLYVAAAGIYWVIGFFVISGYCIQLSVARLIQGNAFSLRDYLIARGTRILPLYYLGFPDRGHRSLDCLIATILLAQRDKAALWSHSFPRSEPDPDIWLVRSVVEHHQRDVLLPVLRSPGLRRRQARHPCDDPGHDRLRHGCPLDEWVYFAWNRTLFVRGLGMLFGLGTIWFLGALVAEYRALLGQSPVGPGYLRVLALRAHPGDCDVVLAGRPSSGRLPGPGCGVYLDVDAIRRH